MSTCPVCGRVHLIVWPQFWPYRRGARLFCSEDCLIVYVTQQNFSKYKGAKKKMARLKNDGTPAKKPGRKPKTETPEGEIELWSGHDLVTKVPVEDAETPEEPKVSEVKPLTFDGMEISALRHPDLGEFYFDKKYNMIDWRTPEGDEVSLGPVWWKQMITDLPKIMKVLGLDPGVDP